MRAKVQESQSNSPRSHTRTRIHSWLLFLLPSSTSHAVSKPESPCGRNTGIMLIVNKPILTSHWYVPDTSKLGTTRRAGQTRTLRLDFPGSTVDKNPPSSAGDPGSIADLGRSHMWQSNLSPGVKTTEPACCNDKLESLGPVPLNKRSHRKEKPSHCKESIPLSPQLEKAHAKQRRPSATKNKLKILNLYMCIKKRMLPSCALVFLWEARSGRHVYILWEAELRTSEMVPMGYWKDKKGVPA